jgi:hypothetical protein
MAAAGAVSKFRTVTQLPARVLALPRYRVSGDVRVPPPDNGVQRAVQKDSHALVSLEKFSQYTGLDWRELPEMVDKLPFVSTHDMPRGFSGCGVRFSEEGGVLFEHPRYNRSSTVLGDVEKRANGLMSWFLCLSRLLPTGPAPHPDAFPVNTFFAFKEEGSLSNPYVKRLAAHSDDYAAIGMFGVRAQGLESLVRTFPKHPLHTDGDYSYDVMRNVYSNTRPLSALNEKDQQKLMVLACQQRTVHDAVVYQCEPKVPMRRTVVVFGVDLFKKKFSSV